MPNQQFQTAQKSKIARTGVADGLQKFSYPNSF